MMHTCLCTPAAACRPAAAFQSSACAAAVVVSLFLGLLLSYPERLQLQGPSDSATRVTPQQRRQGGRVSWWMSVV